MSALPAGRSLPSSTQQIQNQAPRGVSWRALDPGEGGPTNLTQTPWEVQRMQFALNTWRMTFVSTEESHGHFVAAPPPGLGAL